MFPAKSEMILFFSKPKWQDANTAIIGLFTNEGWISVTSYPNEDVPVVEVKFDIFPQSQRVDADHDWYESLFRKIVLLKKKPNSMDIKGYGVLMEWLHFQVTKILEPFEAGLIDVAYTMIQGAKVHVPSDRWRGLLFTEHRDHARDHIKSDEVGDRSEDHLAHGTTRMLMTLVQRNKKIV